MRPPRFKEVIETSIRQLLEFLLVFTGSDAECTHEVFRMQFLSLVD